MILVFDNMFSEEICKYLLTVENINSVRVKEKSNFTEIYIEYNDKLHPMIILKYIELFLGNSSSLIEFKKETRKDIKHLKYNNSNSYCDLCFYNGMKNLFNDKNINAIYSNYNSNLKDICLDVEYTNYTEEELIELIRFELHE